MILNKDEGVLKAFNSPLKALENSRTK